MTIKNTQAEGERGWTGGRNPGAIERQEKAGQQELVADSALPVDGLTEVATALGITVKDGRADDPLFVNVELPAGLKLVATGHDMWSHLVDEQDIVRAEIFYKAAYYDRRAFIRLSAWQP